MCGNVYVSLCACVRVCASVLSRRRWEEYKEKEKEWKEGEVCLHAFFPGERCIGGEQRRINQEVVVCISECIWRHSNSMGTGEEGVGGAQVGEGEDDLESYGDLC